MYSGKEAQQIADKIIEENRAKEKEDIIKDGLKNVSNALNKKPEFYLAFGPYWWIMKKFFASYIPEHVKGKWYGSGAYNAVDVNKYGFEDDFLSYAAAMYYFDHHWSDCPSTHIFTKGSDDGEEIYYTIFDEDAPAL